MKINPIYLLILVCLVMVAIEFTGYNKSFDDANYLLYAHQILNHTFTYSQNTFAYGYLLPATVAGAIYLFSWATPYASSIPAVLEYITLILLIYSISLKLSNSKIAFSVALIAATSAFIVAYSSRILPDLLAGNIIGIAIYLLIQSDNPTRKAVLCAGMASGALIFVKLGTLSICLPIALMLILSKPRANALIYLLGAGIVILSYLATIGFNTAIFQNYDNYQISLDQTTFLTNVETSLIFIVPFLVITNGGIYWQIFGIGMFLVYAFVGFYIATLKKEWKYIKWGLVLIIGMLYLMFGSESLTSYIPITTVSRYFVELSPLMAILTTRFLKGTYDFLYYKYKPSTAEVVLVCLVIVAIFIELPFLWYFHAYVPSYVGTPLQTANVNWN